MIENSDSIVHRLDVKLTRQSDDKELINGAYKLPKNRGVRYDELLSHGEKYSIEATLDKNVTETTTITVDGCADDPMDPGGNRPFMVRAFDASDSDTNGLSTVFKACDVSIVNGVVYVGPKKVEINDNESEK